MLRTFLFVFAVALMLSTGGMARAAMLHDELFDGDLPDNVFAAPQLQASFGSNKVRTLTGPTSVDRRDQFQLVLPAGGVVTNILVDGLSPGEGSPGVALSLLSAVAEPLAGITLTPALVGSDVVASFADAIATSGSLRFDIVEDSGRSALQLDFVVTPLPAAAGFLATGLVLLGVMRRRR